MKWELPHNDRYRLAPGFTFEILPVFNWRVPVSFTLEILIDDIGFITQVQLFGIGFAADAQTLKTPCRCYKCKKEEA